jgi:hypothetical protein
VNASDERCVMSEWAAVEMRMGELAQVFGAIELGRSKASVARAVGLSTASDLTRWLRVQRLPPYRLLRNWYIVVSLVDCCGASRSLARSSMYRMVRATSGRAWGELREHGAVSCRRPALLAWRSFILDR